MFLCPSGSSCLMSESMAVCGWGLGPHLCVLMYTRGLYPALPLVVLGSLSWFSPYPAQEVYKRSLCLDLRSCGRVYPCLRVGIFVGSGVSLSVFCRVCVGYIFPQVFSCTLVLQDLVLGALGWICGSA